MSWKYEIYRCFFVALGMFEVITNFNYLMKKDGINLARKQHGELPANISNNNIKVKVYCMFISGVLFLIGGITAFINKSVNSNIYTLILTIFSIYAICEAAYYKYWKTISFACISVIVAALFIIL